jgi:putative addiction module killer protein/probable addiction module antidote protein
VQARPRNVAVYESASGAVPFDDWMRNLNDPIGKAAIEARIALLRRGSLGKQCRDIGDGLIELKVNVGPGYRIYIADDGRDSLILFAGRKNTQKQDIRGAKKYWADYKMEGVIMPRSRPYKVGLEERLRDPKHVAAYLNAAGKESQDVFLLALRDVAEAHKISKVALAAGVNRETLYRTLSASGNPTFTTLESILAAVGVELYYRARAKPKRNPLSGRVPPAIPSSSRST